VAPDVGATAPDTQIAAQLRDAPPLIHDAQGTNFGLGGELRAPGQLVTVGAAPNRAEAGAQPSYAETVAAATSGAIERQDASHSRKRLGSPGEPVFRAEFRNLAEDEGKALAPTAILGAEEEKLVEVPLSWQDIAGETHLDQAKTVLALIGALALLHFVLRLWA
jgi:hypothetical protein